MPSRRLRKIQLRRRGQLYDAEPSLRELLDDPVVHLVMERDGVRSDEVEELMTRVRTRLLADRWHRAV